MHEMGCISLSPFGFLHQKVPLFVGISPYFSSGLIKNHIQNYRIVFPLTNNWYYPILFTSKNILLLNPDFAVYVVARLRKPQRNEQLERFCDEDIFVNMLRSKIVKQALQQGFSSRSRWLLQILGHIYRETDNSLGWHNCSGR